MDDKQKGIGKPRREKLEFSKLVLIVSFILYVATWIVVVVYMFMFNEVPAEMIQWPSLVFGAECIVYAIKSAIENKAKILKRQAGEGS